MGHWSGDAQTRWEEASASETMATAMNLDELETTEAVQELNMTL